MRDLLFFTVNSVPNSVVSLTSPPHIVSHRVLSILPEPTRNQWNYQEKMESFCVPRLFPPNMPCASLVSQQSSVISPVSVRREPGAF